MKGMISTQETRPPTPALVAFQAEFHGLSDKGRDPNLINEYVARVGDTGGTLSATSPGGPSAANLAQGTTDAEIERYLRKEQPYDCAGSFKLEGAGFPCIETGADRAGFHTWAYVDTTPALGYILELSTGFDPRDIFKEGLSAEQLRSKLKA